MDLTFISKRVGIVSNDLSPKHQVDPNRLSEIQQQDQKNL
ncbi:hypothetical protein LEP1GSC062_4466 [Leptospira alexanderi serovar Manhao 3 str. L 60]|uniref:Uncharacterized protein n=1 Tax=Leptospira alexanderi serovar Manhao 3 str. L 60 TaxID=1049759 RepID=V6IFZ2_9LEPT|nr:hypothetical protein LEP1GSC062_4466 [Leptospira alexanderi serovar Manhao 3 str. L 60]